MSSGTSPGRRDRETFRQRCRSVCEVWVSGPGVNLLDPGMSHSVCEGVGTVGHSCLLT